MVVPEIVLESFYDLACFDDKSRLDAILKIIENVCLITFVLLFFFSFFLFQMWAQKYWKSLKKS